MTTIVKEESKTKKADKGLKLFISLLGVSLIIGIIYGIGKVPLLPYDIDNYRYTFSAALQPLAAIFAFIASSTIIMLQLSGENSPKSLKFFPKGIFIFLMFGLIIILILDTMILMFLPKKISSLNLTFVNMVIVFNAIALLIVVGYIILVINWLKPETTINLLLQNAKKATTNQDRLDIVFSLEELAGKAIQKGYSSTVKLIIDSYSEIIKIYTTTQTHLNERLAFNVNHPLREIPDSLARITLNLCRSNMDDLVSFTAWPFSQLVLCKDIDTSTCAVETHGALTRVIRECFERNLDSPAYNFSANLCYAPDKEDNAKDISWCLEAIVKQALVFKKPHVIVEVLEGLNNLTKNHSDQIRNSSKAIVKTLSEHPDILTYKGWFSENTIAEEIEQLRTTLKLKRK